LEKVRVILFIFIILFLNMTYCFEKQDLPRMEKRLKFFQRGHYAISINKVFQEKVVQESEGQQKIFYKDAKVNFYYISKEWYDKIFSFDMDIAGLINEEDILTLGNIKLSSNGIRIENTYQFDKESSCILCYLPLYPIRFDDAICYKKEGDKIIQLLLKPYSITPINEPYDKEKIEKLFNSEDIKPNYIIKTEEGLWTLWEFNLDFGDKSNISTLFSPTASLIIPSGGIGPTFYNYATGVKPGTKINFLIKAKVIEDEKFPIPIKRNPNVTLFDTHIHITTLTDLRDSVIMARKYGFKYGLLSILYNEGPYKRLFLGDEDMFMAMERYPDVFVGLGLWQMNENGFPGFPRKGPDDVQHILNLWKKGCKGIKTLEKFSNVDVSDPKFDSVYKKIAELRMPMVFHTEPEGKGCSNTKVAQVAEKFPQIPVIMAHLYNEEQLEKIIPYLKKLPNLYIQHMHLTYVKTKDGKTALQRLVEEGLSEKIIFGSDLQDDHSFLISNYYNFRNELKKIGLSDREIEKIMFKTAEELFSKVKPVNSD
jgi:predicted TIM-barrel fold metal-dependent hydrolase